MFDFPMDPECTGTEDNDESAPEFSDTIDNDGDTMTDFPMDPECMSCGGPVTVTSAPTKPMHDRATVGESGGPLPSHITIT